MKKDVKEVIQGEEPHLNNLLSPEDLSSFKGMVDELRDTWTKKQMFRTETEARFSVLQDNRYPTKASKYWQCIREQNVFWEELVRTAMTYQKLQGELDLAEIEYDEIKGSSKKSQALRKIKDAEIKEKQFALMRMRFCKRNGELEFNHKMNIDQAPVGFKAWFLHTDRKLKDKDILKQIEEMQGLQGFSSVVGIENEIKNIGDNLDKKKGEGRKFDKIKLSDAKKIDDLTKT